MAAEAVCHAALKDEKAPPYERRAWVRHRCDREVVCQPRTADSGVYWPARVEDLSSGGVGLVLNHRVTEGAILSLSVQGARADHSCTLLVRVVRLSLLTACPGLRWHAGCEFVQAMTPADLETLFG